MHRTGFLQVALNCSFEGILGVPRLAAPRGAVMGLQPGPLRPGPRGGKGLAGILHPVLDG